jgi:hypothetical protein
MASNSGILIPASIPTNTAAITNDIRPIKPPVAVPNPWAWVYWSAGLLLAVAMIAGAVALIRSRQKRRAMVPPIPPHIRARQKIDAALLLINDPRAFCIAVSDAVRVYLEERFNLRAPERTTEEFLRDLQKTPVLLAQQKSSLATFLEQCDLVKFARFEPPETLLRELHESALQLVHETQYDPAADQSPSGPPPIPTPVNPIESNKPRQDAGGKRA